MNIAFVNQRRLVIRSTNLDYTRRMNTKRKFFIALSCLALSASLWAQNALVEQLVAQLPKGSAYTVLYASDTADAFKVTPREGVSSAVTDAGPGVPFAQGRRVKVDKAFTPVWSALALSPTFKKNLPKGHVLLVSFWTRAPEMTGGRNGIVNANLEKATANWDSIGAASVSSGAAWRQVFVSGTLAWPFPSDGMHLSIHLGQQEQIVELGGLVILDLGNEISLSSVPYNKITWSGSEANASWRSEADSRIEKLRRGNLTVKVVDGSGKPVPNASVHIEQIRRSVTFGSYTAFGDGLLATTAEGQTYRAFYDRLFDRATVPLYWADWGWVTRKGSFRQIAEWATKQDIDIRGHVLIYPGRQFMPASTKGLSAKALQKACLNQIKEVAVTMKDVPFRELDVTNELRDLTEVTALVGREGVVEWFRQARLSFPGVKLALNENTLLTAGGSTEANQVIFLEWYHYLKSQGVAPDVLGFQAHFGESLTDPRTVWKILDRFARETDAELQITEFDISTVDEEAKARYTRDFMTACFAHPRVTAFTMWGFWEGDHWIPRAASWNKDWTPKPAGLAIEDLLGKKWRTDEQWITDKGGTARGRVWLGTLNVTVTVGTKTAAKEVTLTDPTVEGSYEIVLQ
jgi:endo-1,4-beta-xylanase